MLHCPECGLGYSEGTAVCPADGSALRADATTAVPTGVDELIGRVLDGKYRLDELLGEGGWARSTEPRACSSTGPSR